MTQTQPPRRGLGRGLDALFGGGGASLASPPPPPEPPAAARDREPEAGEGAMPAGDAEAPKAPNATDVAASSGEILPAEEPRSAEFSGVVREELPTASTPQAPEFEVEQSAIGERTEAPAGAVQDGLAGADASTPAAPSRIEAEVAATVPGAANDSTGSSERARPDRLASGGRGPQAAEAAPARTPPAAERVHGAPAEGARSEPAIVIRRGYPELLDIDVISPNPEQPRTHFEPERLHELADSIREHGILQPLIVSRDEQGGVRLIAGERRLQAARLAGLVTVPVVFRETEDTELLELALIENIQRADLNAIEEAMAYRRLTDEYGLTQEEAARRVGKSRATVTNALRLLQLEPEIRRSLVHAEISEGHARALLGIPESKARLNAWRDVVKRRMSVRDTEAHVRRVLAGPAAAGAPSAGGGPGAAARRDAVIGDIERRLRRRLSTRVTVTPVKDGARITVECYSAEELEHVITQLLGDED